MQSFVVAGGFKGFKMVPPGPHFLSYNAASRSGDFAPTIAQLLHLAGRQVVVRRWSPQQEMLLPLSNEDEVGHTVQAELSSTHCRSNRVCGCVLLRSFQVPTIIVRTVRQADTKLPLGCAIA